MRADVAPVAAALLLAAGIPAAAAASPVPPAERLYLCPPDEVPAAAVMIHRYRGASLVALDPGAARTVTGPGLRALSDPREVRFRSWAARLEDGGPAADGSDGGPWMLVLAGPADPAWIGRLAACGLERLHVAHPFAEVVRGPPGALACALGLETSEGYRVVRAAAPLPPRARLARSLWPALESGATVGGLVAYGAEGGPAGSPPPVARSLAGPVGTLLEALPGITYLQPRLEPRTHLDLAVQPGLGGVEPVWSRLGLEGEGIVIAHNDTGVDLAHPDLGAGAVGDSVGRVRYTDSGHGTHTAAVIVGRGGAAAPVNDDACGDLLDPLPEVRGVAPAATLVTNNRFEDGLEEVPAAMAWAAAHGAVVSANSWGLVGPGGSGFAYSVEAAQVDAAVRDAAAAGRPPWPLTVVFSAGNLGPAGGTVSTPGTAKNAITVGATQNARCGSWVPGIDPGPDPDRVLSSSSRGPAQGRVKPDLVAPGSDLLAAESTDPYAVVPWDQPWTGGRYALATGTSQAAALVAGAAGLVTEHLWYLRGVRPSPAAVKASLVAGAVDLGRPLDEQGSGRLDLERAIAGPPGGSVTVLDSDRTTPLASGASWQRTVEVASASVPLTVVLTWTDVPGEADAIHPLVNDLDLVLEAPDGTWYRGNRLDGRWSAPDPGPVADGVDTVEVVRVRAPPPGIWAVTVRAASVPLPPPGLDGQDYALVIAGDAAPCAAPAAPDGLEARPAGPRRVELTWRPVAGAAAYRVRRAGGTAGGIFEPVGRVAAPATSFADDGVEGGVAYRWVVEAEVDPACVSPPSAEAAAVPDGPCLLAPGFAGLAAARSTGGVSCAIELRWSEASTPCPAGVIYDVYRRADPGPVVAPGNLLAAGVDGTAFRDDGLRDGVAVRYAVRARDPVTGVTDANEVVLETAPAAADTVWLDGEPESDPGSLTAVPASDADTGTAPWAVSTADALTGGASWACTTGPAVGDQALVTADPLVLPAGPPVELVFHHRTALDEGRDGGRLEYSTDGGRRWHDIRAGDGAAVATDPDRFAAGGYDDRLGGGSPLAGVEAWSGHSREWREVRVDLRAFARRPLLLRWRCAAAGRSPDPGGWWVDGIRLRAREACQSCPAPPPPSSVEAVAAAGGVRVGWHPAVTGAAHVVERDDGAGGPLRPLAATVPGVTSYLDGEVSGGSVYRYAVRSAVNGCRSERSVEVEAEAAGRCTLAPEFFGLVAARTPEAERCGVELEWLPATSRCPGRAPLYRVYRSAGATVGAEPAHLLADSLTATVFRDVDVRAGERYRYLVRARHSGGVEEDANLRVRTAAPLGVRGVTFADGAEESFAAWRAEPGSGADPGTEPWRRVDDDAHGGGWSLFVPGEDRVKDQALVTAEPVALPAGTAPELRFWHLYDHQVFVDGGRLEYSLDGGATWHDILDGDGGAIPADEGRFLQGGYSGTIQGGVNTPIGPGWAWTGFIRDWSLVRVDLADFAGREPLLRWRIGCNSSRHGEGWWVDDVEVSWPTPCDTRAGPPRSAPRRLP